jgi:hypothetical protein
MWPEFLMTSLLAAVTLILLAAAVAAASASLLLGLDAFGPPASRRDPAAAFTRLRYLSLRRCSLAEAATRHGSGGSGVYGCLRRVGLALWGAAQTATPGEEQTAATAGGVGPSRRQRACSATAVALLHCLLPPVCAAAEGVRAAGAAITRPRPRTPPPPPLHDLLASCPQLRFVDLTYVSGAGTRPDELARLAGRLAASGSVHYLAVSQPGWLPLGRTARCGSEGERGPGSDSGDEGEGGTLECARMRAGASSWGLRWLWGFGRGGRLGAAAPQARRSRARRPRSGTGAPLLLDCAGLDAVISRELGF